MHGADLENGAKTLLVHSVFDNFFLIFCSQKIEKSRELWNFEKSDKICSKEWEKIYQEKIPCSILGVQTRFFGLSFGSIIHHHTILEIKLPVCWNVLGGIFLQRWNSCVNLTIQKINYYFFWQA